MNEITKSIAFIGVAAAFVALAITSPQIKLIPPAREIEWDKPFLKPLIRDLRQELRL